VEPKGSLPCHTKQLTNYMQQSPPWESNSHSASGEMSLILWNPKAHYRVHKIPPLVPVLSQMNPVSNLSSYFPKVRSGILPSTLRCSEWSLPFRLSDQNFVYIARLRHACYVIRPSHCYSSFPWREDERKQMGLETFYIHMFTICSEDHLIKDVSC
jgi:hypothetical protein